MNREALGALLQLNAEKNIPREQLVASLAEAIESAYRRATPGNENVYVEFDEPSGGFKAYRGMMVVEEVLDPQTEWTVDEARKTKSDAKIGDLIKLGDIDTNQMGRVHAQIAQQLFRQRLREVEREQVFGQYAQRESEIITGTVSRVEPRGVILDVGRAEAVLPVTDQSATEHYRIGQHVKAYVLEVRRTTKGPLIYVSRTHKNFLRRLFELEVPEIHGGTVEVKAIAREAGSRSKVAVASRQEGLDPVGATVGQRGGRVQAVVAELGGEKIDIIPWHEDPAIFVANALSPAQVVGVEIDEENRIASVTVPERMLSLAIGREGQNARLAAKLTGWRIDIRSDQAPPRTAAGTPATETPAEELPTEESGAVAEEPVAIDGEPEAKPKVKRTTKAKAAGAEEAAPAPAAAPEGEATPGAEAAPDVEAAPKKRAAAKKKATGEEPAEPAEKPKKAATAKKASAKKAAPDTDAEAVGE